MKQIQIFFFIFFIFVFSSIQAQNYIVDTTPAENGIFDSYSRYWEKGFGQYRTDSLRYYPDFGYHNFSGEIRHKYLYHYKVPIGKWLFYWNDYMIECGKRIETDSTKVRKIVYYDNNGNDTLTFQLNPQEEIEEVVRRDTAFNIIQTISYRILESPLDLLRYAIEEKMRGCSVYDDARREKTNKLLTDTFGLKNITNEIWEREPHNGKEFVEGLSKAVNPNNIIVLRGFDFLSHKKYLNNRHLNLYPCLIVTGITSNPDKTINIEWWCEKGTTETLYNVKEKYLLDIFCYYGVFAINQP